MAVDMTDDKGWSFECELPPRARSLPRVAIDLPASRWTRAAAEDRVREILAWLKDPRRAGEFWFVAWEDHDGHAFDFRFGDEGTRSAFERAWNAFIPRPVDGPTAPVPA